MAWGFSGGNDDADTAVDDLADPAWSARFDERLDDFADAIDTLESPLNWTEIQATLEEYRITPEDSE